MEYYLDTPLFGITLSILAFLIGVYINKKIKLPITNPLLISSVLIIGFLLYFNIDYEIYNKGGSIISFFIAPATVVLAVPLYKNITILKEKYLPILIGIITGSIAGVLSIVLMSKFFGIDDIITISLLPKSTTAAISMELSRQIGGIPSLTVAFTVVTGIVGNSMALYIFKFFRIKDDVAQGVALGTTAHVLGTTKAMEFGEVEGALSSLSISLAGIISIFLIPLLMKLLSL